MEQPPGFVAQGESGLVCKLRRSLYRLKQSPRAWFGKFSQVVQNFGMTRSEADHSIFYCHSSSETSMSNCKPLDSPMDPNMKLMVKHGEPYSDPERYRKLVGKLIYLTITKPDISFAVGVVSQFKQAPCVDHWAAVLCILRYIKKTPGQGLLYEDKGDIHISGYCDANWAGSPIDKRSTTGFCISIRGNVVSWKSKKQNTVAHSSAEAEYQAMASITCELIWVKQLIQELKFVDVQPMKLYCDNQAALHIASNPVFHERTKHIEIDYHFVREKLLAKEISTKFVNSSNQLADTFTKSLRGSQIQTLNSITVNGKPIIPQLMRAEKCFKKSGGKSNIAMKIRNKQR
ncbi:Copia protein, partial [Mucuna pruriens]